jgi:hypothetical protein
LYSAGRTRVEMVPAAMMDLVWLALFVVAWFKTAD